MNLLINLIPKDWTIIIFDEKRKIIDQIIWNAKWQESDTLFGKLEEIVAKNKLKFENISKIIVINWPWWFTWTRTTSLIINTIRYLHKNIKLYPCDFFKFGELMWKKYPMLIKANKREYLVKDKVESKPEIKIIDEIAKWNYFWIWDNIDFENKNIWIKLELDYSKFLQNFVFGQDTDIIRPIYIKEPNITC